MSTTRYAAAAARSTQDLRNRVGEASRRVLSQREKHVGQRQDFRDSDSDIFSFRPSLDSLGSVEHIRRRLVTSVPRFGDPGHSALVKDLSGMLESARRAAARMVNAVMTANNWEIGRRIVEFEQGGEKRAEYGAKLLKTLAADLTKRFERGFSRQTLQYTRQFYITFPPDKIRQTASGKSAMNIRQTLSSKSETVSRIFRAAGCAC